MVIEMVVADVVVVEEMVTVVADVVVVVVVEMVTVVADVVVVVVVVWCDVCRENGSI